MFKWTVKTQKATNAIFLDEKNNQEGRPFKSRFLQAGLVKYDFGVCLLKKESIDKFINTFVGCPVIINHQDDIDQSDIVGTIKNIWFSPEDGWFWCDGIITDEKAVELIEKGYNISCQYRITDYIENNEGKLHNANPYDKEILNGVFEHLAIVENPRYEDAFIAVNAYIAINNEFKENDHPRDKDGKFTEGSNRSSFYNPQTKVIELNGNELGSSDDEIRENGLKYFKENYQGRKFNNPELKEVLFSRVGLNKLKSNSADIDKIKAIPALKDIVEKGKYIGEENPEHKRNDGIVKFHRINHDVSIAGKKENMSVLIGEDRDGNRFYNLNNTSYSAENSLRVIRAKGRADNEFHINIIARNSTDFNPSMKKYNKVFDYIKNYKGGPMDKETKGIFNSLIEALKARNEADEKEKDDKAQNEDVDKRKLIDEVGGILKGKIDEELWRTIIGKIEKVAYDKSSTGTADNEDDEDENKAENKKAKNEKVDKRERIRQIMALVGELGGSDEQVRTVGQWAEDISYNKSEAGTADNKAKNKCKNEDEEKQEEYKELKEKVEEEAANKKAKNSLDDVVNKIYDALTPKADDLYVSSAKGLELGKEIYG